MTIHVYQDLDPLGSGKWFSYVSRDGHILEPMFGGYDTEEQAYEAARSHFSWGL
jgi:hypothetical protein